MNPSTSSGFTIHATFVRDSGMEVQRLAAQERLGAGFRFVPLTLQILSTQQFSHTNMCDVLSLDLAQDLEKLSGEQLDTLQCIASVFAGEARDGGVGSRCVRTKFVGRRLDDCNFGARSIWSIQI